MDSGQVCKQRQWKLCLFSSLLLVVNSGQVCRQGQWDPVKVSSFKSLGTLFNTGKGVLRIPLVRICQKPYNCVSPLFSETCFFIIIRMNLPAATPTPHPPPPLLRPVSLEGWGGLISSAVHESITLKCFGNPSSVAHTVCLLLLCSTFHMKSC